MKEIILEKAVLNDGLVKEQSTIKFSSSNADSIFRFERSSEAPG